MSDDLTPEQKAALEAELSPPRRYCLRELDVTGMIDTDPPNVPWVVEGLAVKGCLTMLAGREGTGKSLFSMAIASAMSVGDEIAGLEVAKGRVLVVDAENGEFETHRRIHTLGIRDPERLDYLLAEGFHLGRDLEHLEAELGARCPDLLILDGFRSLWPGGEENGSPDTSLVLDPLRTMVRRLGVATILLHHTTKGGDDYRGSSAIGAAVELGFTLGRHKDDPERASRRRLVCWKCRPGPEPATKWFRLHSELDEVFVEAAEAPEGLEGVEDQENAFAGKPVQAEIAPKMLEVLASPCRWATVAERLGRDPKNGTLRRVRDRLLALGEIVSLPDGTFARAPENLEDVQIHQSASPSSADGSSRPKEVPSCQRPIGEGTLAPTLSQAMARVSELFQAADSEARERAELDQELARLEGMIDGASDQPKAVAAWLERAEEVFAL